MDVNEGVNKSDSHYKNKKKTPNTKHAAECKSVDSQTKPTISDRDLDPLLNCNSNKKVQKKDKQSDSAITKPKRGSKIGQSKASDSAENKIKSKTRDKNTQNLGDNIKDTPQKEESTVNSVEANDSKKSGKNSKNIQTSKKSDSDIKKKKKKSIKCTKSDTSSQEKDLDVQKDSKQEEKLPKKQKKKIAKQKESVGNEKKNEVSSSVDAICVSDQTLNENQIVSKSKKRRNRKKRILEALGITVEPPVTKVVQKKKLRVKSRSVEKETDLSPIDADKPVTDAVVPKCEENKLKKSLENKKESLEEPTPIVEKPALFTEKHVVEKKVEEKPSDNKISGLPDFVPRLEQLLQDSSCSSSESSTSDRFNERTSVLEESGSFFDNTHIDSDISSDNPDFEDTSLSLASRREDTFADKVSITNFLSHDNVEGLFRSALLNDITLSSRCSEKEVKNFFNTYGTFSEKNRTQFAEVEKLLLSNGKYDDPAALQLFQPEKTVSKGSQEKEPANLACETLPSNIDSKVDACTSHKCSETVAKHSEYSTDNTENSHCRSNCNTSYSSHYSIPGRESVENFPLSRGLSRGLIYTSPNPENKVTNSVGNTNIDSDSKVSSSLRSSNGNLNNRGIPEKSESRLLEIVENVLLVHEKVREQLSSEKFSHQKFCQHTSSSSLEEKKEIPEKYVIDANSKSNSPTKESLRNINCVSSEIRNTLAVKEDSDVLEDSQLEDTSFVDSSEEKSENYTVERDIASDIHKMKPAEKIKTVRDQVVRKTDKLSPNVTNSTTRKSNSPSHSANIDKMVKLESQGAVSPVKPMPIAENINELQGIKGKVGDNTNTRPLTPGGDMSMLKETRGEKSKEDVKAEREAKKAAKLARKMKAEAKSEPVPLKCDSQINSVLTRPCDSVDGTVHVKQVVVTKVDNSVTGKSDNKPTISDVSHEPKLVEKSELVHNSNHEVHSTPKPDAQSVQNDKVIGSKVPENQLSVKSKAELKAERRAKQEAQRAAKALQQQHKVVASQPEKLVKIPVSSETTIKPVKTLKTAEIVKEVAKPSSQRKVKLFNHLYAKQELSIPKSIRASSDVHPAITCVGVQYASKVIVGSNARCLALMNALKKVIEDYKTPPQKDFSRGFEAALQPNVAFLEKCRPLSVSMTNALKHLKCRMRSLPNNITDSDAKKKLQTAITTYIRDQIEVAGQAICNRVLDKILNGDVILTYGCSSLIQRILIEAHKSGKKFRVIIVDGRPWKEGKEMLRRLVQHGLHCSYVVMTAASFIMREATKVLMGAHALLINGYVMSRVGASQIALLAHSYCIPVLVCCESHKFSERVQTDSIVYNEISDPDKLATTDSCTNEQPLMKWRNVSTLTPLNIIYDVTPPGLVSAVVTELSILPCTIVPVVLRMRPAEIGC